MNFAILGTGMVAAYHQAGIDANHELGAILRAVSHHDPLQFESITDRFGVPCRSFQSILEDAEIDVVCICTPSGQHAEQAIACAEAGKHILVEKPMALSLKDADAMIEAARSAGVQLSVALQRRMDPLFIRIKTALEAGDLGELTLASVVLPYYRDQAYYDQAPWRGTWALDGGGVLMNQGIHIVDLLVWMMGDPVEVSAYAGTLQRNIEVEDTVSATLKFGNGALGTITASTTIGGGAPHRLEIYGTNGSIQVEGEGVVRWSLQNPLVQTVTPYAISVGADAGAGADPKGISADGHTAIIRALIEAINTNQSPSIDGMEGRRSLAAVNAVYTAAGFDVKP